MKFIPFLLFLVLPGCELLRRPPIVTDMMRGQAEENHAAARTLNAYASIVEDYARCLEAKNPKNVHSNVVADCGPYPTSPVTVAITDSRKAGEIPQFQMMPPIPLAGTLSAVME